MVQKKKLSAVFSENTSDLLYKKLNQSELASCMKYVQNLLLSLEMKGSLWHLVHCNGNDRILDILVTAYVVDSILRI